MRDRPSPQPTAPSPEAPAASLSAVHRRIIACTRCPRLRAYCRRIAREKRAAYRHEIYWGRPVPGFGDAGARVLVLGLAPAAHGANRTGRVFTGDGPGGSGDFLMRAMHRTGFANQATSTRAHDGLRLTDAFIAAAVRCAPPDNRPTRRELAACRQHLADELAALPQVRVVVALGRIAFEVCRQLARDRGTRWDAAAGFGHGLLYRFAGMPAVIASYHPSRQNTNTGRLTTSMLEGVFRLARRHARMDPS